MLLLMILFGLSMLPCGVHHFTVKAFLVITVKLLVIVPLLELFAMMVLTTLLGKRLLLKVDGFHIVVGDQVAQVGVFHLF
jgi:hypothetical protein